VHEFSGCSRGRQVNITMREMWQCGARGNEVRGGVHEKDGTHAAKCLTCCSCATANAAATCKRMRSRRCGEQTTRVREDIVKKMQHDTTRS
jgi:hypothetical protein